MGRTDERTDALDQSVRGRGRGGADADVPWFEENRLTKPVLDMRALAQVHTLRLFGNPIEYLPEMHHAFSLRSLSVLNVGSCTWTFFF